MVSDIGIYRGHQIFYSASRKEIGLTPAELAAIDQAEADTVSPIKRLGRLKIRLWTKQDVKMARKAIRK